jgi:drug/metabolite transporter (DMT)-like permease
LTRHRDDLGRAALYMTASGLLFAGMGVGVKMASAALPNAMVVFFRSAVGLLALLPWLLPTGIAGLRTRRFRDHLPRTLFGLLSMYAYFYAIAHLPLSDAVLLNYTVPLFVPLVERTWLGARVPGRVWWPLAVGLAGIALILKPGSGVFQPAAVVAVLSAVFGSIAQVGVRQLTDTEPTRRIVFYFAAGSTLVSALPLPWAWRTPPSALWPALLCMGVLATLGQLLMTRAYRHATAAQVGPFMYTAVVFAALLEFVFWGRLPDRLSMLGALFVVAAGMLALRLAAAPLAEDEDGAPPNAGGA